MKKFEIIKDKWIKRLNFIKHAEYPNHTDFFDALKISSIIHITASSHKQSETNINYQINLWTEAGNRFIFDYTNSEEVEFKNDLSFLENLILK